MADELGKEQEHFESQKAEWLKAHEGQWVWIHEAKFTFYPSFEEAVKAAYTAGYDKQPIFVKQVTEKEELPNIAGYYDWAV